MGIGASIAALNSSGDPSGGCQRFVSIEQVLEDSQLHIVKKVAE